MEVRGIGQFLSYVNTSTRRRETPYTVFLLAQVLILLGNNYKENKRLFLLIFRIYLLYKKMKSRHFCF